MQVILIGDSIRHGYQPVVSEILAGKADVWGPDANGGDSRNVLDHLEEWVLGRQADVVHLNCGLHDIKRTTAGYQVPLDRYAANLREIVRRVKSEWSGELIWATTTPVLEKRHNRGGPFERHVSAVESYNAAARQIMEERGVQVNDLYEVIRRAGPERCLKEDGVHMNEHGNALLAEAVAAAVIETA